MRVLIYGLNTAPEPTGTGKYTGELAAWLATRGHEVRVVAAPPYYPAWKVADAHRGIAWRREWRDGVLVRRCPLYVPAHPRGVTRVLHLASFAASSLPVVLAEARAFRPAVLLAVAPTLATAPGALLAAQIGDGSSWLHVQDFEVDAASALGMLAGGASRVASALERRILGGFDHVSSITRAMCGRLADKGVAPKRISLLPNWVDCEVIRPLPEPSPLRADLDLPPGAMVALYAGNLGEKQGVETLAELGQAIEPASPIHLVIAGEGAARTRIESALQGQRQVHLLPLQPADRLNDLLNLADVHLLPQRADAADLVMPSKLSGMLASGRPVVAGAVPGTELARAIEGCGVAVLPGDAQAMLAALDSLARHRERRLDLGRAARACALAEWDRAAILAGFEEQLFALAGGAPISPGPSGAGAAGWR